MEEGGKKRRLHVGNGAYGVTHGNVCTPEGKQHTQQSWRCPPAAAEAAGHQRGREDPLGPSPSPNAAPKGRRGPPVPPSGPAAGMEMAAGVLGGGGGEGAAAIRSVWAALSDTLGLILSGSVILGVPSSSGCACGSPGHPHPRGLEVQVWRAASSAAQLWDSQRALRPRQ